MSFFLTFTFYVLSPFWVALLGFCNFILQWYLLFENNHLTPLILILWKKITCWCPWKELTSWVFKIILMTKWLNLLIWWKETLWQGFITQSKWIDSFDKNNYQESSYKGKIVILHEKKYWHKQTTKLLLTSHIENTKKTKHWGDYFLTIKSVQRLWRKSLCLST